MDAHPGAAWRERLANASRSKKAWEKRCAEIRIQILTAAGLYPEWERPPVKAEVKDLIQREGYSIEKVRIETYPGFWLTGNLYRPIGNGRRPGVLSTHGHWKEGRYEHSERASQPGRAIGLARLGCVVFSYDMVGYGDFTQLEHKFGDVPWGLSLLGLQLWNSLRAFDFLAGLPDVDPKKIGMTGASGGGTQTFLLAAVEPRLACAAPVNMVAAGCQGGCLCENAPLLRIDLNNVEIAAACAPRPLLLPSCTGDWTADTPTLEGPAVAEVFAALGVPKRFRWVQVDADHNYNQETREYVYAWFNHWLCGKPLEQRLPEKEFSVESREVLAVYPKNQSLPFDLVDAGALQAELKERIKAQLKALWPRDAKSARKFRELMQPALKAALAARFPLKSELEFRGELAVKYHFLPGGIKLRRDGAEPVITVVTPSEAARTRAGLTLILPKHDPEPHCAVGVEIRNEEWIKWRENYPLTYHRTELSRQVQDVLTAVAAFGGPKVRLEGVRDAGVPVLLARALVPEGKIGPTTADLNNLDDASEATWSQDRVAPAIMRIGGLRTASILSAPGQLTLCGTYRFDVGTVRTAYRAVGAEEALTIEP